MRTLLILSSFFVSSISSATTLGQVIIQGGGEVYDGKGTHVRSYSTFPSLIRLKDGTLLSYDMASTDGGRSWG